MIRLLSLPSASYGEATATRLLEQLGASERVEGYPAALLVEEAEVIAAEGIPGRASLPEQRGGVAVVLAHPTAVLVTNTEVEATLGRTG